MSGTSYVHRLIDVTFTRGKGKVFASSGTNIVTLSGYRVSAQIAQQGGISQGTLDLRIYGMSQSVMNDLTFITGTPLNVETEDTVAVSAGDADSGMAIVYEGTISGSMADYSQSPNVPFHVMGMAALEAALMTVPPSSYQGGADVAIVMTNLAKIMNKRFENNGVSGIFLSNPYFDGSPLSQAQAAAEHAGINLFVDGTTLAIWPAGGARGGVIPLISASTGLVGYPVRTAIGVDFTCLYNPTLIFGGKVQLDTSVLQASGTWSIKMLDHTLESEVPGGSWFSHVTCVPVGFL